MNSATLLDFPPPKLSACDLMVRALDPHVLIGMPHLNGCGLSETWLMKELGHRHWLMLALHLGMDDADFRTADGEEAYAAICASSLTAAQFGDVQANDILTIRSVLSTVSRTQISTRHEMSVHGRSIGACELVSTFVRRMVRGDNHSITRVMLREPQSKRFKPSCLARTAADVRNGRLDEHFGFPVVANEALRECRFEPSLSQDFNGAGLLYFAEFQALADRAFESWFPDRRRLVHRDVFFLGNIQPNESVFFGLLALSDDPLSAQGQLRREDGYVIAKIFCRWAL